MIFSVVRGAASSLMPLILFLPGAVARSEDGFGDLRVESLDRRAIGARVALPTAVEVAPEAAVQIAAMLDRLPARAVLLMPPILPRLVVPEFVPTRKAPRFPGAPKPLRVLALCGCGGRI